MPQAYTHDLWAPLNHKTLLGDGIRLPVVASWVPRDQARRLAAYRLLRAYADNVTRYFMPDNLTDADREKYREYGHGGLLVDQARAAVLGDTQTITVPAAHDDVDEQTTQQQVEAAARIEEQLQDWARLERLALWLLNVEGDATTLGDGIYELQWDPDRGRPVLEVWDPGFYFPVLEGLRIGEYPGTIHMAWEETTDDDRDTYLHRVTWRLGPIRPATVDATYPPEYAYTDEGRPIPQDGDSFNATTGQLERRYAWQSDAEPPSTVTCHLTHAIWNLRDLRGDLFDLSPEKARYVIRKDGVELRDYDLRLDFIPLLHMPNTITKDHFGQSIIMRVAQVLDDLHGADSDLAENSALVGSTPLKTKGVPGGPLDAGPGARFALTADQDAEFLDTSKALDALIKYVGKLEKTLSTNSRLAEALLGRIDASDVPSGYALALSFSPTSSLVRELRAVRDEKYSLLLKMVTRMYQGGKVLPAGPTPAAELHLGAWLPADVDGVVEHVTGLLEAKAISTPTAVAMLQAVGLPIDDAEAEVARIREEDFERALQLLDALGDEQAVAEFLGRQLPVSAPAGDGGGDGGAS